MALRVPMLDPRLFLPWVSLLENWLLFVAQRSSLSPPPTHTPSLPLQPLWVQKSLPGSLTLTVPADPQTAVPPGPPPNTCCAQKGSGVFGGRLPVAKSRETALGERRPWNLWSQQERLPRAGLWPSDTVAFLLHAVHSTSLARVRSRPGLGQHSSRGCRCHQGS